MNTVGKFNCTGCDKSTAFTKWMTACLDCDKGLYCFGCSRLKSFKDKGWKITRFCDDCSDKPGKCPTCGKNTPPKSWKFDGDTKKWERIPCKECNNVCCLI